MESLDPKSFDFNARPDEGDFPGSRQLNEIWRWVEGLPASTANAIPLAEVRKRSARLERIELLRDPNRYASPHLRGRATFRHGDHPHYTIGHDEYEFKVNFGCILTIDEVQDEANGVPYIPAHVAFSWEVLVP